MNSSRLIIICLMLLIIFSSFDVKVNATVPGKVAVTLESAENHRKIKGSSTPLERQKIVLHPFFRLQKKNSKAWVERILVTFLLSTPTDSLTYDFNNPVFRKKIYDLLQSTEPEANVQLAAAAVLTSQLANKIKVIAQISRSVIIVH